jgi:hypothetical protein
MYESSEHVRRGRSGAPTRPALDQHALHHGQRRLVLEYAYAGRQSKYRADIGGQVDVGGSEVVGSFFHKTSMAGHAAHSRAWPKLGKLHWPADTLYG